MEMKNRKDNKMIKTNAMKEREKSLSQEWKDEGDGYFSIIGTGTFGEVAYVALPKGHPDIGKTYVDLCPEVNGGLTFGDGNVYGWDYGHAYNSGSPTATGDIKNVLLYFRNRAKNEYKQS